MKNSNQSGQIIVLLLLIMLVGLTIGLSITSRTLQQMKVTSVSEQSSRAYSGAEAAIETALKEDLSTIGAGWHSAGNLGSPVISRAEYMVEEEDEFVLTIQKDDVAQVNLQGFSGDRIDIYWAAVSDEDENPPAGEEPGRASLEVTFIRNEGGSYSVVRFALNADSRTENGFTSFGGEDTSAGVTVRVYGADNCGSPSSGYCARAEITDLSDLELLRIKPFYNKATVWVDSTAPISTQLYTVSGEATTVADITRRVEVTKAPPALPPVFDYVLFDGSGNALEK